MVVNVLEKLATILCVETAVYWGSPVSDGYGGMTFADPVEIKVRWDDTNEMVTDEKGDEKLSSARVTPLQDLDLNGKLFLGTLADLDSGEEGDPISIEPRIFKIIKFDKIPAFASITDHWRTAYLV